MNDDMAPRWRDRRARRRRSDEVSGAAPYRDPVKAADEALIRQWVGARRTGAQRRVWTRPMRWSQARTRLLALQGRADVPADGD